MTINETITAYLAAKAEQAAAEKRARDAKKRADMLADDIIRHAGGRPVFETDAYTVALAEVVRVVLDTEKLYRDFKDIKNLDQYGKESKRIDIKALARQAASQASA